jgi:hypothetical protein
MLPNAETITKDWPRPFRVALDPYSTQRGVSSTLGYIGLPTDDTAGVLVSVDPSLEFDSAEALLDLSAERLSPIRKCGTPRSAIPWSRARSQ